MAKKITYEEMIEKKPQSYLVEQLSDKELCSFHSICKNKPEGEKPDFEKSRVIEYLPLLESEISKRQITIKKAKEEKSLVDPEKEDKVEDTPENLKNELGDDGDDLDIEKAGKKGQVGETRKHSNGKSYKKQANGKWKEISSVKFTKKDHQDIADDFFHEAKMEKDKKASVDFFIYAKEHQEKANLLTDDEYDDTHFEEEKKEIESSGNHSDEKKSPVRKKKNNKPVDDYIDY